MLLDHWQSQAQTSHFSQFYSSPLWLNPSLTGAIVEDVRVSSLYRNQWTSIGSPFETLSLGIDGNLRPSWMKNSTIGVGVAVINDELVENIMQEQWVGLSVALHQALDVHKRHVVAVGVQAALRKTIVDYSALVFASQYENYIYNPNLPSGEDLLHNNLSNTLFNAGISWEFKVSKKLRLRSGLSVYDILKDKENIFEQSQVTVKRRFGWHGGASIKITDRFSVHPELMYLNQNRASDLNAGGYVGYAVGPKRNVSLYAGPWFRWKEAAILMGGIGYKNLNILGSYDMTVSQLKDVTDADNVSGNMVGAYEISLVWKFRFSKVTKSDYTVPCGIF